MKARPLKRHCGILSEAGRHKLQVQLSNLESHKGYRFTLQVLARQTQLVDSQGLHFTTIKEIVEHQIGVDERLSETFFGNNRGYLRAGGFNTKPGNWL
ncbi:MAG: hypothetical protein ACRC1Z_06560 [Waterburya sp.]